MAYNKQRVWLVEFLSFLEFEKRYSKNTLEVYKRYLGEFFGYLEKEKLSLKKIDHRNIRAFLSSIQGNKLKKNQKKEKSSMALIVSIIRAFFKFCVRKKYLDDNPALIVSSPKFNQGLPVFLTEKECEKFCQAPLLAVRNKAIIEVLYSTGIRVGELIGIDINDLDFEGKIIRITKGKGGKERLVLFGKKANQALRFYLDIRPLLLRSKSKNALFLNYRGQRLSVRQNQRIIKKCSFLVGLEKKVTPHSFRHSFASHLLSRGADLRVIQELLGHKSLGSTEKYLHIDIKRIKEAYEKASLRP